MIHYLLTIEEANSHETINKTFLSTPTYISLMHSILMGVFVFLFIIIFKGQSFFFLEENYEFHVYKTSYLHSKPRVTFSFIQVCSK